MNGKKIILIALVGFMMSGCTLLTVGYEQSYCEENGEDYSDAGVCDDPMTIYNNRHALSGLNNKNTCSGRR